MTTSLPSHRRLDYHYIAMQVGFWSTFAAICAYQAALLGDRGFSDGDIGILVAVRCLAGILCQPLLGSFADRHPHIPLRRIVVLSLLVSLVASVAFQFVPMGMSGTLIVLFLMGGFEISAYPLMDAMAIQYINAGVPIRYSLGRGLGSFSYAICALFLGFQATNWGSEATLYTHLILLIIVTILVATYPVFRGELHQMDSPLEKPHSALYLLKTNPSFALMLFALMLGITGIIPLSTFLVNLTEQHGGTPGALGWAYFAMAASELPTAFFFQKLYRKLGSGKMLVLSMAFCTVKAFALFCAGNLALIILLQPLQMLGYGLFTPSSVFYVNESVPAADRVQGQTLMMVASNGMGGVLGSLLGGQALEFGGVPALLIFSITFCAAATGLAVLSIKLKSPKTV